MFFKEKLHGAGESLNNNQAQQTQRRVMALRLRRELKQKKHGAG